MYGIAQSAASSERGLRVVALFSENSSSPIVRSARVANVQHYLLLKDDQLAEFLDT